MKELYKILTKCISYLEKHDKILITGLSKSGKTILSLKLLEYLSYQDVCYFTIDLKHFSLFEKGKYIIEEIGFKDIKKIEESLVVDCDNLSIIEKEMLREFKCSKLINTRSIVMSEK